MTEKKSMKYFLVWKQLANLAISSYFSNRIDTFSYFLGKIIRFVFFLVFIIAIFNYTDRFAGYDKNEMILFYLTFNLLDTLAQAFFRGIYIFKNDVRTGNFDFLISKPINSLFYSLSRMVDILDIVLIVPLAILIAYYADLAQILTLSNLLFYLMFIVLGLLVAIGFHIISASFVILFIESESFIWLYRDLLAIGRFPPEAFSSIIQVIFTYVIPIFIITAFPAKALLGMLDFETVIFTLVYVFGFFTLSILIWNKSLKHYSSASS